MDKLTALNQTQIVGSIPEAVLTVRTYATTAPYEPRFSVQIVTQHRTKHEVSEPQSTRIRKRGLSQVSHAQWYWASGCLPTRRSSTTSYSKRSKTLNKARTDVETAATQSAFRKLLRVNPRPGPRG